MRDLFNVIMYVLLASLVGCNNYEEEKKSLVVVAEAIDTFYVDEGKYPENLKSIVPKYLDKLPALGVEYEYKIHGKYYLIYFPDWGSQWNIYWSKDKKWYKNDFTDWPEE